MLYQPPGFFAVLLILITTSFLKKLNSLFWFDKNDVIKASSALHLCLLLRRLSYPNRLWDLQEQFGKQLSTLCKLLAVICKYIYTKWGHLLLDLGSNKWFTAELMKEFADVIQAKVHQSEIVLASLMACKRNL